MATCRTKVALFDEPEGHEIMRIPCNLQCLGFEEQLKEIDDTIFGEVLTKETSTKRVAGEKEVLKEISQLDVTNANHNADKADGSSLRSLGRKDRTGFPLSLVIYSLWACVYKGPKEKLKQGKAKFRLRNKLNWARKIIRRRVAKAYRERQRKWRS